MSIPQPKKIPRYSLRKGEPDKNPHAVNRRGRLAISDYEFKDIPFSVLFDEIDSETFVFVGNEYDYKVIEQLINEFK